MQYTIEEYYNKLLNVDWYYAYTEDMRVWEKGKNEVSQAEFIASKQPELKPLYLAFCQYVNKQRSKPTLEEFN